MTDQLKNSFAEATIVAPDGEWIVCGLHLTAHAREENETERERELSFVFDRLSSNRSANRRHILAGDFNANAPYQRIDIAKTKPRTQEDAKANGGQIPRRAIQKVLDAGYVDTLHAVDPSQAQTAGSFSTQFPGQRVDYIFTHGVAPAAIKAAWIEHDRLAKYASDHFPIGAEIVGCPLAISA
jgi:endonuclease/exonuclease/phosphatase family metal-dependent hydrolase